MANYAFVTYSGTIYKIVGEVFGNWRSLNTRQSILCPTPAVHSFTIQSFDESIVKFEIFNLNGTLIKSSHGSGTTAKPSLLKVFPKDLPNQSLRRRRAMFHPQTTYRITAHDAPNSGNLYLIPCPLEQPPWKYFPFCQKVIELIDHYIVEHEKMPERFIWNRP